MRGAAELEIAQLSVLDEHFAAKWAALGPEWTRAKHRRAAGASMKLVRYADDFVVMLHGTRADARRSPRPEFGSGERGVVDDCQVEPAGSAGDSDVSSSRRPTPATGHASCRSAACTGHSCRPGAW